ncbi:MAG: AAA family ATPase [Luteolibacter sp.]
METIKIFVSSPADVSLERARSKRVVDKLGIEFAGRVKLEPFYWEHEPMRATDTFNGTDNIPLTSDFDIVVCILWSRLGSLLGDTFRRPDGSRYPSGTVYEMETAREAYLKTRAPDLLVYRKTEELSLPLDDKEQRELKLKQFEALEEFIQDWFFDKDDTFKSALTSYRKVTQFENLLEQHLRRLIEAKIEKLGPMPVDGAVDGRVGFASYHGGSPFRGLEPFDFDDSGLFFGRSLAIEEVLDALCKQSENGFPLVVVNGVSGSGKSSLVRAGVVPVLMEPGVAEGIGLWRRADMRPSDADEGLFAALAQALLESEALPELKRAGMDAEKLAKALRDEPEKLVVSLAQVLKQISADVQSDEALPQPPRSRLLIVLDQFEEIFSDERKISAAEREAFSATLACLLKSGVVWGLMTMRADRMAKFQELELLSEATRQHGQVTLMAPSETDLSLMIRLPARAAGIDFEQLVPSGERLEDRLLKEARDAPDGLPLLGFVLQSLYEKMEPGGRMLKFSALEELGGLEGAVASRAEAAFKEYAQKAGEAETEQALSGLMRLLTTLSEDPDAPPLRRVAEMEAGADTTRDGLVEALVENRLLTRGVTSGSNATIYVSHEAIFRKWPRLAELIEKDRKFLSTRRLAQVAAARWAARGRKPEFLWSRGALLEDAKFLLENGETLDEQEKDFAKASVGSAKGRTAKLAVFALVLIGAGVGAYFLMPKDVVKEELSDADKAEIQKIEDRKKRDALELQLDAALADLAVEMWPEPEVEVEWEDREPELPRFADMDVAEISRRIMELEPDNAVAWGASVKADIVTAGRVAGEDPEEGKKLYTNIAKRLDEWRGKDLAKDELLDLKARIAWQQGNKGEAANLWASYLKTEGLEPLAKRRMYELLTRVRMEEGKTREVERMLGDWLEMEDNAVARARRAKIRLERLDYEGASEDLAKAQELQPDLVEVKELAPVLERAAKYSGVIADLTAKINKAGAGGGVPELCERARYLIAMEQYDAAMDDLDEANKRVRGGSATIGVFKGVLGARSGRGLPEGSLVQPWGEWSSENGCNQFFVEKWDTLMEMIDLDLQMWVDVGQPARRIQRGWKMWELGQQKMALRDADKALNDYPGEMNAKMLRIASLVYLGESEQALTECDESLLYHSNWVGFHRFRAEALFNLGRKEEALTAIEDTLRLAPDIAYFHELHGAYLDALGRADEAARARARSVELKNQ